jgi:hypothetical protein
MINMVLLIDPVNDARLVELYRNLDAEDDSKLIAVNDFADLDLTHIDGIVIYHAGGSANISKDEIQNNLEVILQRIGCGSFIYLSDGPDYRNIGRENKVQLIDSVQAFTDHVSTIYSSVNSWYAAISKYCEKKSLNNQISYFLHHFLPLDIDMQGIEILWKKNQEDAFSYVKEMHADWTNEILNKKWAKATEVAEQIADENIKKELSNFNNINLLTMLHTISNGQWDGNNHFHNWLFKINSLITKK